MWTLLFLVMPFQAPEHQHAVLTASAKGVQVYACREASGTFQWSFVGPEASLFDSAGSEIGIHGAGPMWKLKDGSSAKGRLVKTTAAAAGDIPWLLLKAEEKQGAGKLAGVEFIRRSETHGGVAPAGGCDKENTGRMERVPYTAVYTFYAPD